MIFRFLFVFNVLISVLYCAQVQAAESVILVYGDSLSAAYGIPKDKGWVNLLQARLKEKNLSYQVVNASISGETTIGGLSRFSAAMTQHKPSVVVIELGANDGLRGLPVSEMQSNLDKMIMAAKQAKARVILLGMMIPSNYGQRYTRDFSETYSLLSKQHSLGLVPFFLDKVAGHPELVQEDGLHPTANAQTQLLDNVWPVLIKELK